MIKNNYNARVYDATGTLMPEGTTMVPRLFKTNIGDIYTRTYNNSLLIGA